MTNSKFVLLLLVTLAVPLGLSLRCSDRGITTIESITENCELLSDKEVRFKGIVSSSKDLPLVKWDIYKIYDNTGELWVVTRRGCPGVGDQLIVRGKPKTTTDFIRELQLPTNWIDTILEVLDEFEVGECFIWEQGKQIIWK